MAIVDHSTYKTLNWGGGGEYQRIMLDANKMDKCLDIKRKVCRLLLSPIGVPKIAPCFNDGIDH